jgi:hypothetical protein
MTDGTRANLYHMPPPPFGSEGMKAILWTSKHNKDLHVNLKQCLWLLTLNCLQAKKMVHPFSIMLIPLMYYFLNGNKIVKQERPGRENPYQKIHLETVIWVQELQKIAALSYQGTENIKIKLYSKQ